MPAPMTDIDVARMFVGMLDDHGLVDRDDLMGLDLLIDAVDGLVNDPDSKADGLILATWLGALRRWRAGEDLIDAVREVAPPGFYKEGS